MKNTIKFKMVLVAFSVLLFQGCIEEPLSIGEPFDKLNNLSGTWSLVSVVQNDEIAISKGFPSFVQSVDLTNRVGFTNYQLTLEVDASGKPATFLEMAGDSPSILGITSGNWSLDDPSTPTIVSFIEDSNTKVLEIGSYIGLSEGQLTLKVTKSQNSKPILSYVYQFQKITN